MSPTGRVPRSTSGKPTSRTLADHLPIGPPARCAEILSAYAEAGAKHVLLWPVRDGIRQLQACAEQVFPQVADGRRPGL